MALFRRNDLRGIESGPYGVASTTRWNPLHQCVSGGFAGWEHKHKSAQIKVTPMDLVEYVPGVPGRLFLEKPYVSMVLKEYY